MILPLVFSAAIHATSLLATKPAFPVFNADWDFPILDEPVYFPEEPGTVPPETCLRYENFTVIIHRFKGYERVSEQIEDGYHCLFNYCDTSDAVLAYEETGQDSLREVLKVCKGKDTLHLSEDLDNRLNNTVFEIIPKNSEDRFRISFFYTAYLGEVIDYHNLSPEEEQRRYNHALRYKEHTKQVQLTDSADYFFTALPHTPDLVEVTVENGELVYAHSNSAQQRETEEDYYLSEIEKIKKKYTLRDTLVEIPGEYMTIATLTGDGKIFNYHYDAYIFRIDRYNEKKIVESKYIHIGIAYGC